ncbi:Phosphate regulon transcriptional regulatory protein PhoB [BD1-7 clade bacterium]|uniref:Phosphate regulon transcriptional regulatory protein PhoB n=1 Tax=BD1-7 clade bacterium TaxID=2029982 RepID=A0A5S9NLC1_9GAMM|nr:Phosphate regulon transcriptional regulatory protein PhoB [BD1-7 clade bacterium]CAA0093578.1 Phosphate regulon transcriptional regulatory protein PhoB [BD1-7 clade bacterium]
MKILIVDDETAIRDMIRMGLEMSGFDCIEAGDIHEAFTLVHDSKPDLVLLDWMLPGGSGLELLRRLRRDEISQATPVIMLTAKTSEDNKIQGLEVGADDYIAKPFAPRELVARINAVLRRTSQASNEDIIEVDGVRLDNVSHRVTVDNENVKMGPTEYKLLNFFMTHQDRVYTRGQLLDHVWGSNVYVEERTVDVHIRRLRKALQSSSTGNDYGQLVQTVRGAGYRFSASR